MTREEYTAEAQQQFNADRYGWSLWEQETTDNGYDEDRSVDSLVGRLNYNYECRKANRNA